MAMTLEEHNSRKAQTQKLLLYFGMLSMVMSFGGLTSAYIVSTSRPDWLNDFQMPLPFFISTLLMVLSSITFHLAQNQIKKDQKSNTTVLLLVTFALGIGFVFCQFYGFGAVVDQGYYFTGSESTVTTSFLYIVAILHIAHLAGGLIALTIIIYNHYKQKYNSAQTTGIELGVIFWHFLDILWILLFSFFYFY
jgi:cytochrome c oxidase subunit 3